MKNLNLLGRSLSKMEQQHIAGGSDEETEPGGGCFNLYAACNDNVQCCSTNCVHTGSGSTGKECRESA